MPKCGLLKFGNILNPPKKHPKNNSHVFFEADLPYTICVWKTHATALLLKFAISASQQPVAQLHSYKLSPILGTQPAVFIVE